MGPSGGGDRSAARLAGANKLAHQSGWRTSVQRRGQQSRGPLEALGRGELQRGVTINVFDSLRSGAVERRRRGWRLIWARQEGSRSSLSWSNSEELGGAWRANKRSGERPQVGVGAGERSETSASS